MTSDTLANEANEILDAEAARRIDEIRRHVDFICSSLRAKGNMAINQLLQSVRTLTMDEYCNIYGADTSFFLEEQSRKRKGTELVPPSKRRDLTDAAPHDLATPSKRTSKSKELQAIYPPSKSLLANDHHTIYPIKPSQTNGQHQQQQHQQQQHQQQQQQQQQESHHSQQSQHHQKQQKEFQEAQPQQKLQEPQKLHHSQHIQQSSKSQNLQQLQNQHSEAITNGNQMTRNGNSTCIGYTDDEEVEFGPLFVQFIRSHQPKVTFQLDPQEELNPTEAYQLQLPYEFVDQFGPGHRRRIIDQIQHIENQLETFKQRLLHPPSSRSISPSSPSPSL